MGANCRGQEPGHCARSPGQRSIRHDHHWRYTNERVLVLQRQAIVSLGSLSGRLIMEQIVPGQRAWRLRFKFPTKPLIAWAAISGGVIVILGSCLPWFSLFAGLQPYRGVDVLNGRLLAGGGALSIVAGVWFLRRGGIRLRWGIGLLGFALTAFASWSLFQLLILYRQLSAD